MVLASEDVVSTNDHSKRTAARKDGNGLGMFIGRRAGTCGMAHDTADESAISELGLILA